MRLATYSWGQPGQDPILCIHGIRAYGLRFRRMAEDLADRFHVVAVDLRGHGESSYDPPWNLATHLADVLETMDELELETGVWVGHSLGGRLALEACAFAPERIRAAILLDPAIQVTPARARQGADSERPERIYESREAAIMERIESGFVLPSSLPDVEEEMAVHLVGGDDGGFRLRYEQSAAVAAWGECAAHLPMIRSRPTLLVTGRNSGFVGQDQIEKLRDLVGDDLIETSVSGGHIVLWDGYDETVRAISDFLATLP